MRNGGSPGCPRIHRPPTLHVNGRFCAEWWCPDSPAYRVYRAEVPADAWQPGRNRITLRAGYRKRHRPDRRELAIALDTLVLQVR